MPKKEYNVDHELLHEFLDESIDEMTPVESLFVELSNQPTNIDLINEIFRPVHSLKGNAPFFGLLKIKELAHKMENLLDLLRKQQKSVTPEIIAKLLSGTGQLREILESVRDGNDELDDEDTYNSILADIIGEATVEFFDIQHFLTDIEAKMIPLREFIEEGKESYLDEITAFIRTHIEVHTEEKIPENIPQQIVTILEILEEPFEGLLEDEKSLQICELLKELNDTVIIDEAKDLIDSAIDEYSTFVSVIGFDPLLREMILEKMEKVARIDGLTMDTTIVIQADEQGNSPEDVALPEDQPEISESDTSSQTDKKNIAIKTMRVSEQSIDAFLEFVGELLVVQEMFNFFGKSISVTEIGRDSMVEFRRILETFDLLSDNLRKSILAIRTLPVNRIFQKVPLIIHEIADQTGKQVAVNLVGEDLLIDKSYIEILDAPIVHMIRNSIDHGIESAENRLKAGKKEEGLVTISAVESTTSVMIIILDDGAGINYEAVKKKAVEIGLIAEGEELSDEKLVDLLFESGVSTATEVTDISGRGVGMDVVKRNIESLGGTISITSETGLGTTNTISLPRNITTQIVDGFLVKVSNETYVLPMSSVYESYSPLDAEISTVAGKGTIVKRHDALQQLVSMYQLMKLEEEETEISKSIIVSVEMKGSLYALAVDQILGVQKVVVKTLNDMLMKDNLFSGAALMGDGSVAMVIDMERMYHHTN